MSYTRLIIYGLLWLLIGIGAEILTGAGKLYRDFTFWQRAAIEMPWFALGYMIAKNRTKDTK